ncbi:UNVERIFIED_CONTAM: hypothetical protein Sradi_6656900 [Sesamum radiatum]|uniref:Retrotransposon Copia-like N-terminal domain-containing protein n=1 Tax=Sesamum radiatum TaxID=300843 RepID=A0AAW2JQY0_SESRA
MVDTQAEAARVTTAMAGATEDARGTHNKKLELHGANHPRMVLASAPLIGKNYLAWSCAIQRSLSAKSKLCFIDDSLTKPAVTGPIFYRWIKVNSMVTTWILSSILKEIVGRFMYSKSARILWLDLVERYGESNGPLVYKLQRENVNSSQGNMSVEAYYTKLRELWEEFVVLMPTPQYGCGGCTLGVSKAIT